MMKTRTRQWVLAAGGIVAVVGVLVGVKAGQVGAMIASGKSFTPPAESVTSTPVQVRQALAANNYLAAVGQTKGALVQVNLTANTDLRSVKEFQQLVIREQAGSLVRLGDVADVVLGAEDYDVSVAFSGQTAVFIGIWSLPNANSLDVIKRIRAEMASLQKELPEQIQARIAFDGTAYIRSAIDDVVRTLLETLVIVVLVIFLFLGSLRSVLVPVVAIPGWWR